MSDARARLLKATACAERLAQRNREQAATLKRAARSMADRATTFASAPAEDDASQASQARALRGRYLARQLASDDA